MALMLALAPLDHGNSMSPSAVEKSRRELARRDCLARGIVSGGQDVGRSRQGSMGLRRLGIGGRRSSSFEREGKRVASFRRMVK